MHNILIPIFVTTNSEVIMKKVTQNNVTTINIFFQHLPN